MTSLLKVFLLSGMVAIALGKTCKECLAECKKIDAKGELDCPDSPECSKCFKELKEFAADIQADMRKDMLKRDVYQKFKNMKRQAVKEELEKSMAEFETKRSLVAAAFKQAAKEGTQPENMMKRAIEIAGDAVQDVGEELTKRFICFGFCITAAGVAAAGALAGGAGAAASGGAAVASEARSGNWW